VRYTLREPAGVALVFDPKTKQVKPKYVLWQGKWETVKQVGFHHTDRRGRVLFHIFSVTAGEVFLRLELDTDSLHWYLTEVSDGLPD